VVACRPLAPEPGHTPDLVATWYAQANTSRKKPRHPIPTKRSDRHSSRGAAALRQLLMVSIPLPRMSAPADERAKYEPRREHTNAEPDDQSKHEPRQDIARQPPTGRGSARVTVTRTPSRPETQRAEGCNSLFSFETAAWVHCVSRVCVPATTFRYFQPGSRRDQQRAGGKVSGEALANDSGSRIVKTSGRARSGVVCGAQSARGFLTSPAESGASIWKLSRRCVIAPEEGRSIRHRGYG
jgi:hypothetical protein